MSSTLLVFNSASRRATPQLLDRLVEGLQADGEVRTLLLPYGYTSFLNPAGPEAALREAVQQGTDRVLIAGGDGTIHWAVQHLAGAGVPLGILPLGTGNILARELRLPLDPERALRALRSCQEVRLDLGTIEADDDPCPTRRYFVAMAGLGLDADLVRRVPGEGKRRWGRGAFVLAGCRAIGRFQPFSATLNWDDSQGQDGRFWAVLFSNTAVYSGLVNVAPEADPTDGYLDVTAVSDALSRGGVLFQAASVMVFRRRLRGVTKARIRCLEVVLAEPVPIQADGELLGLCAGTLRIRVIPGALPVLIPT